MIKGYTDTNNQTILVNTDKIITVKPSESGDHHKAVIDMGNGKEIHSLTPIEQIYRQSKCIGVQVEGKSEYDINPLKVCIRG